MELEDSNNTDGTWIDPEPNWFYDVPSEQIWMMSWDNVE